MLFSSRGAAFWKDGAEKRLFYGTLDGQLWAIDPGTGKPVDSFGKGGFVDLREGMLDPTDKRSFGRGYGMTSPPAVYKNVVICGSIVPDSEPQGPNGDVRAFDARTGSCCGVSIRLRNQGKPAARRGRRKRGKAEGARTCGRFPQWIRNAELPFCR
jgi:Glucose dehydrogenase